MAMHEYGYNGTAQYSDYLELEDNLNFALQAIDEDGLYYFLIVYTKLGNTTIIECGPMSYDEDIIPEIYNVKYRKIEVDESEIDKTIIKFLGRKKRLKSHTTNPFDESKNCKVVEVRQLSIDKALNESVDVFKYFRLEIGEEDAQLEDN